MTSSSNHFLRTLLLSDANVPASAGRARAAFKLSTIGDRFRKQLQILAKTLNKTNPHYIRCVKPNSESRPGSLDSG
jgi:myosin-5